MQLDCNSQTVHSTSYRRFSTSVLYLEYFESSAIERDLFFIFSESGLVWFYYLTLMLCNVPITHNVTYGI